MCPATETATDVRPFRVEVPEEELAELRRRIEATRWPSEELVADRSQGVQLATLQAVARWLTEYDWRACEERLNALPQFTTEIDGVDVHFHPRQVARTAVITTAARPGDPEEAALRLIHSECRRGLGPELRDAHEPSGLV